MVKKSVINNYIPYKTPRISNYYVWHENYKKDLVAMFKLTENILYDRYDILKKIDYNDFCLMIYKSSSKYIRK